MTQRARRRLGVALGAVALVVLVIASSLASCVVPLGDGRRRVVAGELTREVILPTYEDVVTSAAQLQTAVHAFVAAPDQNSLDWARAAWREARTPWKQTDAFRFGPLTLQSLGTQIDQFPVDPPKIEPEIAGTTVLDATYFANLGANKKGFHSIEYLLFGPDDAVVLAAFTTDANADRRRAFVAGCADHLAATTVKLRDAWLSYALLLAAPGADNADYPTIKASIDAFVNETVFQAEVVADARIGKPMGTASGGVPHPELQESAPSGHSIADMTHALESIRNIYYGSRDGAPGKGIGGLVVELSPATDREVRTALDTAFASLAAIPTPYTQSLLDARPEVMTAYTAVQELQHILATEVIGTLGATLKFNDNDGD